MSTKPTINLKVDATKVGFTFCDNTAQFSNSNPTGWKPGDWSINNVTSATLKLTLPDGTSPTTLVLADFPSLDCVCREILPADFSMSEFESGKYKLDYTLNFSTSPEGPTVIQTSVEMYHFGKVQCCIERKKREACDYTDDKYQKWAFNGLLLESAMLAACKGDTASADKILTYLNNKCNCKCC